MVLALNVTSAYAFKPRKTSLVLIVMSVVLPAMLFALAAWENYNDVAREAEARVRSTVGVLNEHATKVFETHRLTMDLVKERLKMIDWTNEAERASLHQLLQTVEKSLDQIATITIVDADGMLRASSRAYPVDTDLKFNDRDWFIALKEHEPSQLYISRSYIGRQSGQNIFNIADRVPGANGEFQGVIAISVDRAYFEKYYSNYEPGNADSVFLIRDDGTILARAPATSQKMLSVNTPFMQAIRKDSSGGLRDITSSLDGITRIVGYRRVSPLPIYVGFALNKEAAQAPWWRNLRAYGLIAFLSALALLAVSSLAIREMNLQRLATQKWQDATMRLQTEAEQRERAEGQLRQMQKMDAIGQLTGGIAHDFNNMLAVIISSLSLARKRLAAGTTDINRFVDAAMDGATRAALLTSRLMAFSRQQPLMPQQVNPSRLVGGMSEMIRRALGETIQMETVLGAGLWTTHADPAQLESALLNLSVNARDAMPDGGRLTIETSNSHLDEAYGSENLISPGQYVLIAVTDSGTGMPPDVVAKAFDPFFTTKEVGKGTGLGLSQVHGFVKQSGGHLKIYSEPGHGTTIKMYLPRLYDHGTDHERTTRPAEATIVKGDPRQTILVVEDEPRVRELTTDALRELDYTVIHADGAEEALRQLADHPETSLLFTDIVMPGLNGRKLADEALLRRPDLKVMFTTGFTRNAIVHNGVLDAGLHFIAKPFTLEQLATKVKQALASPTSG